MILPQHLTLTPCQSIEKPWERVLKAFPKLLTEEVSYYKSQQDWWDQNGKFSHEVLEVFSESEQAQMFCTHTVQSALTRSFEDMENPSKFVFWKVHHSILQWGAWDTATYEKTMDYYLKLKELDFGSEFEVMLDHSRYFNMRGTSKYTLHMEKPVWIDGVFGLMVHHKGKHVLTVGFSFCEKGVLIQQIQLRMEKGNRWLFKLPRPLVEYTLHQMMKVFPDVWLIDGASAVGAVRYNYRNKAEFDAKGAAARIQTLYSKPLEGLLRTEHFERSSFDVPICRFWKIQKIAVPGLKEDVARSGRLPKPTQTNLCPTLLSRFLEKMGYSNISTGKGSWRNNQKTR